MSLNDEKMLILKMLEEGKITSEEAARLIEALDNNQKDTTGQNSSKQQNQSDPQQDNSGFDNWKKDFKSKNNTRDFDRIMEDFSQKAEKLGRNVAETTFGLVDKMTDFVGSFVDTNSFRYFGNLDSVDKSFSVEASEGMTLNVEAINGQVVIKKASDNKIVINSKIRSKLSNAIDSLSFESSTDTISIRLNNPVNMSVAHEIFLPAAKLKEIRISTTNAKIYVEDSIADSLQATTKNGQIELMGVKCSKISLSTKNAKVLASYVTAGEMEASTSNSPIDLKHIKIENLKALTTNGRITIEDAQNNDSSAEMGMFIKSTNGRIKINTNDSESRGYKIKALTTHGHINLLIPDMLYKNIGRQGFGGSSIETESTGFDNFAKKVLISAETSNSYIEIGK